MGDKGILRIFLQDDTWATIPVTSTTTCDDVCALVRQKRNYHESDETRNEQYVLCMCDAANEQTIIRSLKSNDFPLIIQETLRKHGQSDNFNFMLTKESAMPEEDKLESSASDEEGPFGIEDQGKKRKDADVAHKGYLQKKGQRNKAWRTRWFELRDNKLCYSKSRNGRYIGTIDLVDTIVGAKDDKEPFVFEIFTSTRIFQLKASSTNDMATWINAIQRRSNLDEENGVLDDIQLWLEDCESIIAETQLSFREQTSTLEGTLLHPHCVTQFLEFLKVSHCAENLEFYLKVEEYKDMKDDAVALLLAQHMLLMFLSNNAQQELRSLGENRDGINAAILLDPHRTAFQGVQSQVFSILNSEPSFFPKFVVSDCYSIALLSMPMQLTLAVCEGQPFPLLEDFYCNKAKLVAENEKLVKLGTQSSDISSTEPMECQPSESREPLGTSKLGSTATSVSTSGYWGNKRSTIFDDDEDSLSKTASFSPSDATATSSFADLPSAERALERSKSLVNLGADKPTPVKPQMSAPGKTQSATNLSLQVAESEAVSRPVSQAGSKAGSKASRRRVGALDSDDEIFPSSDIFPPDSPLFGPGNGSSSPTSEGPFLSRLGSKLRGKSTPKHGADAADKTVAGASPNLSPRAPSRASASLRASPKASLKRQTSKEKKEKSAKSDALFGFDLAPETDGIDDLLRDSDDIVPLSLPRKNNIVDDDDDMFI